MRRGLPLITCALLAAVIVAVGCVLIPLTALAENTAEQEAPGSSTTPATDQASADATEAAEQSGEATAEETTAGGESPGSAAGGEATGQPAGNTAEKAQETPPPVFVETPPPVFVETPTPAAGENVAEGTAPGSATGTNTAENGAGTAPPVGSETVENETHIAVPIEETVTPSTPTEGGEVVFTPTSPAAGPPPAPASGQPSNTAEGRPAGTGARNRAEGGRDTAEDESKIAVPPEPEYQLPSPAELAGAADSYRAPEFSVSVPALQVAPEREPLGNFIQPERNYLAQRPLPGLDEMEPEEERVARSIEESLALLDLAMEERSEEGAQIPLPSGVMTFRAANSFQYDRRNKILSFAGDVELLFNDIGIMADLVEVNDSAATAYAKGYVMVAQDQNVIYCDEAYLNYDTGTLELFWVEGNTGGKRLYEPLYYEADRAYGTFDHIILEGAIITTCDPFCGAHRDYEIKADKVHYKPGKSIVLHNAYLFLRDTKVAWFPTMGIPLPKDQSFTEDESDVKQTYGWSRSDGYYAKFGYTYWTKYIDELSKPLKGFVKMDLMTKRGAGMGVRQDWYVPSMGPGTVLAYYREDWPEAIAIDLIGRAEVDAGEEYNFTIKQWLNLSRNLNGAFELKRTNGVNSTGISNDSWNGQFDLTFAQGTTRVGLSGTHNVTTRGGGTTTTGSQQPRTETAGTRASFTYNTNIEQNTTLKFTKNYTANKGGLYSKTPADQEGNYNVELAWSGDPESRLHGYSSRLIYKKSNIDYDGNRHDTRTERDRALDDRLPSFSLTLPRDLLGEKAFFNNFTINIDRLRTGKRSAPKEATSYHVMASGSRNRKFSRASSLTYSTALHQYWYSDSNSQWVVSPNLNYNYDPGDWWKFQASWNMTYQQGVRNPPAPRHYSYSQRSSYKFTFGNRRSWRWIVNSGFDFKTYRHSSIGSSFNWDANRLFGLSHTANYNIESDRWLRSTLKATWKSPYTRPNSLINWMLVANMDYDTDYFTDYHVNKFGIRYFKSFRDGWSGEVTLSTLSGVGVPDPNDDYRKIALQDYIKKVVVRKTNCCTSWEATWRPDVDDFSVILFLNALPQYAGNLQVVNPFESDMDQRFLFPSDQLRQDILSDVVGLSADQRNMLRSF